MKAEKFYIFFLILLSSCTSIPDGVKPVQNFDLDRYLGKWYEIARMDHSFEKGLSRVTAEYSIRDDGGVRVLNRGYAESEQKWKEAEGKALFVGEPSIGFLKVSFFGPFYGSYIIFELDSEYRYALVSGQDKKYFWILSRNANMDAGLKEKLIGVARKKGFDTDQLIHVEQ